MRRGNIIGPMILGLILGLLAVESYRTAPVEGERQSDGPAIHWGNR